METRCLQHKINRSLYCSFAAQAAREDKTFSELLEVAMQQYIDAQCERTERMYNCTIDILQKYIDLREREEKEGLRNIACFEDFKG